MRPAAPPAPPPSGNRPPARVPSQEAAMESRATIRRPVCSLALAVGVFSLACSSSGGGRLATLAPGKDPRVGLRAGLMDAAQAAWNLRLVSNTPPSEKFAGVTNSDLSFSGN